MFLVIELQTTSGVTTALVEQFVTYELALQKYYLVLSYAAVSTIDTHASMLIDTSGRVWKSECFKHAKPEVPAPESDAESES